MIAITGATGVLNGRTVEHLLRIVPPSELTIIARDPERAERFARAGATVRAGRYEDPAGLREAFRGADRVLLVSSNDPGGDTVALHRNAIEAAVAAGVGRVLYTSHQGAHADSPFPPARVHAATEAILAGSGASWTALRNGFYAHSLDWLLGSWRSNGPIAVPADGPVSWTSRDDVAEAAAVLLGGAVIPDGPVTLTAPAAPRFADLTGPASEVAGRPIGFEIIDAEHWVRLAVEAGQPEMRARFSLTIFQAAERGFFAGTDPLLGTLLGREPLSVREALALPDRFMT